jgi:predicted dehydrogenase
MNTLNIAVWTVGEHARRNILPAINKSESVNLFGMFTRNIDVLSSQSEQYDCHAYNNSDELLQDSNVDAVYISSPNALHNEQVKQCLLNNKHVIVEKSALTSLKKTQEIIELAKNKNLVVMEAFMFLYHRQFSDLKKLIKSEKYGKILFLEADFGFPHLDKSDIRYSKKLAGGALNDAGAYTISAALNLLGLDSELIFSSVSNDESFEVDTSGLAILRNKNIKAICRWVMGASYKNEIRVWCEYGHIVIDRAFSKPEDYIAKIQVFHNGALAEERVSGKDNHFINILECFSSSIVDKSYNLEHTRLLRQSEIMRKIE